MVKNTATGEASTMDTAKRAVDPQRVVWDDSRMNTSYSNVCNVVGSREEITLLFGANQAWHAGQKEVKVLLQRVLKEYETRFGELKLEP